MNGSTVEKCPLDQGTDVLLHHLQPLLFHEIDFVEHDDPPGHAEQLQNVEMLPRLRHDAVVSGDHEESQVDAADAGNHRLHKALVTRYVDDGGVVAEEGKSELDGDAASFFLRGAIGILARQPFYEQRLAVVDVTCSTYDRVCISSFCYTISQSWLKSSASIPSA